METRRKDDEPLPDDQAAVESLEPEFGEQEEAAQEAEWVEDAEEGGASEH